MQQNVTVTRGTCNRANRSTTFPMFSNRNVTHRTRTSGPLGGSSQTNGPGHRECTVANHGRQRPPFEHTRRVSGPGHSMTALTRGPATSGAQFKLPSHSSACSPHAVRGATWPRRQRCVSVKVNPPYSQQSTKPPPNFPVPVQGPPGHLIITKERKSSTRHSSPGAPFRVHVCIAS